MSKDIALVISEDAIHPSTYKEHLFSELDELNNNSCDSIFLGDLFDYINIDDFMSILNSIIDKVKTNGLIHIQAPDIFQLCWYAARMNLDLSKLRYILYENKRKTSYTFDEMISVLENIENIKITTASYSNGYEYSISVQKNETD